MLNRFGIYFKLLINLKIMKTLLRSFSPTFKLFGFFPGILFNAIIGLPFYIHDYIKFKRQMGNDSKFIFGKNFPILSERFSECGTMSGHYFHQDLLVAKKIFYNNPKLHVDIGSRTDGFVAHLAVFRKVEVFDIRDQRSNVENIVFKKADLMQLPENLIDYCDSISALHSIEHFGLGRYGDVIDYNGYLKAIENIYSMLKRNGKFYFSVPIGSQRIEFNAHRVFSLKYLMDLFKNNFYINSFSYVDDRGDLYKNIELSENDIVENLKCNFGCGIFEMTKI